MARVVPEKPGTAITTPFGPPAPPPVVIAPVASVPARRAALPATTLPATTPRPSATAMGQARAAVDAEHLPPPTRAAPFPPAGAVAGARALERLARDIGAPEARVRTQPAPADDRMIQLYRSEANMPARLIEHDKRLVGEAELLRETLAGADGRDRGGAARAGADAGVRSGEHG